MEDIALGVEICAQSQDLWMTLRSDAGVGIGMLRGAADSLMYLKIEKVGKPRFIFLYDMKFICKLLEIFVLGHSSFSGSRLLKFKI